jgi:hypothetical protein
MFSAFEKELNLMSAIELGVGYVFIDCSGKMFDRQENISHFNNQSYSTERPTEIRFFFLQVTLIPSITFW